MTTENTVNIANIKKELAEYRKERRAGYQQNCDRLIDRLKEVGPIAALRYSAEDAMWAEHRFTQVADIIDRLLMRDTMDAMLSMLDAAESNRKTAFIDNYSGPAGAGIQGVITESERDAEIQVIRKDISLLRLVVTGEVKSAQVNKR